MRAIESECGRRILITDEQDEFILLEIREVDPVEVDRPEEMYFLIIARQLQPVDEEVCIRLFEPQMISVCFQYKILPLEAPFEQFQWTADGVGDAGGLITGDLCVLLREMVVWMPPKIAEAFQRVLKWVESRIKE